MKQTAIPTIKPELRELILEALRLAYTSSGKDSIETGNHYQSLALGEERTNGFRGDRGPFLDQLDFRGKTVVDLGSNLGEISRDARARGASLVDGYEYDPFFVELAQLLNAYNGTSAVSFYERDITDPRVFDRHYDLVLAFSVFTYIRSVLRELASITDEALVVETHKLQGNLEDDYINPIRKYLPVFHVLGESDWGRKLPESEKRAVIVFAKDDARLAKALGRRPGPTRRVSIDAQRTSLQQRFFESFEESSGEDLIARVAETDIDLASVANDEDLAKSVYSGRMYWQIFVKGYCQYLETQTLGKGNVYYDYIVDYYAPRRHDPGVADALRDPLYAVKRLASRFRDLDQFRKAPDRHVPEPVRLFQTGDSALDRLSVYEIGREEPLHACRIDGWHRLFAARIFGATKVTGEVVETAGS